MLPKTTQQLLGVIHQLRTHKSDEIVENELEMTPRSRSRL